MSLESFSSSFAPVPYCAVRSSLLAVRTPTLRCGRHHRLGIRHPASRRGRAHRCLRMLCCAPVPCAVQALRGVLAARGPGSLGFVGSSSGEIMRSMAPCGTCIRVQDRSTTNSTLYAESERLGAFCDATTESWTPDGPADRDDSGAFRIQVSKNAKNAGSH